MSMIENYNGDSLRKTILSSLGFESIFQLMSACNGMASLINHFAHIGSHWRTLVDLRAVT